MKDINKKRIKKPIIIIGFDKTGKLALNVDVNKIKKMNKENSVDLEKNINTLINVINQYNNKITFILDSRLQLSALDEVIEWDTRYPKQPIKVVNEYMRKFNTKFRGVITLDDIEEIRLLLKTNRKLAAVKRVKEITGCGLKRGKSFIDFMVDFENIKIKYDYTN